MASSGAAGAPEDGAACSPATKKPVDLAGLMARKAARSPGGKAKGWALAGALVQKKVSKKKSAAMMFQKVGKKMAKRAKDKKVKTQYQFDVNVASVEIVGEVMHHPIVISLSRGGKLAQTKLVLFPPMKVIKGFTGTCQYQYNEGVYYGDYVNGDRSGRGSFLFHDGDSYVGSWLDDVYYGHGTYKCAEGVYDGNHVEGLWHGEGKYTWPNGDVYTGRFKENSFHGPGEKVLKKLKKTEAGFWQDDELITLNPLGTEDTGDYTEDMDKEASTFTGFASWHMLEGGHYEGEIVQGSREVHGHMHYANGDTYAGEWLLDKFSGHGMYTCEQGTYLGKHLNGKWHGEGTFTWINGDQYIGEFSESKFHGRGTKSYAEGQHEEAGMWELGVYKGAEKAAPAPAPATAPEPEPELREKKETAKAATRRALLAGLKSGKLQKAVDKMEEELAVPAPAPAPEPEPEPEHMAEEVQALMAMADKCRRKALSKEDLEGARVYRVNKMLSLVSRLQSSKEDNRDAQVDDSPVVFTAKEAVFTVKQVYTTVKKKGKKREQKEKVLGAHKINLADYPANAAQAGGTWQQTVKMEKFELEPPNRDKKRNKKEEKKGLGKSTLSAHKEVVHVCLNASVSCESVLLPNMGNDDDSDADSVISAMSWSDSDMGSMGSMSDFSDEDEDDTIVDDSELSVPYICVKKCLVREEYAMDSAHVGFLDVGEHVQALEIKKNEQGLHRLKFDHGSGAVHEHGQSLTDHGWVSIESLKGAVFLVKEDAQFAAAKRMADAAAAPEDMTPREGGAEAKPKTEAQVAMAAAIALEQTGPSLKRRLTPARRATARQGLLREMRSGALQKSLHELSEKQAAEGGAAGAAAGGAVPSAEEFEVTTPRADIDLGIDLTPSVDIENVSAQIAAAESAAAQEEASDAHLVHLYAMTAQLQQDLQVATESSLKGEQESGEQMAALSEALESAKKQSKAAAMRSIRMAAKIAASETKMGAVGQNKEQAKELERAKAQITHLRGALRDVAILHDAAGSETPGAERAESGAESEPVTGQLVRCATELCTTRMALSDSEELREEADERYNDMMRMVIAVKLHLAQVEMSRQKIGVEAKRERRTLIRQLRKERGRSDLLGRRLATLEVSVASNRTTPKIVEAKSEGDALSPIQLDDSKIPNLVGDL